MEVNEISVKYKDDKIVKNSFETLSSENEEELDDLSTGIPTRKKLVGRLKNSKDKNFLKNKTKGKVLQEDEKTAQTKRVVSRTNFPPLTPAKNNLSHQLLNKQGEINRTADIEENIKTKSQNSNKDTPDSPKISTHEEMINTTNSDIVKYNFK